MTNVLNIHSGWKTGGVEVGTDTDRAAVNSTVGLMVSIQPVM